MNTSLLKKQQDAPTLHDREEIEDLINIAGGVNEHGSVERPSPSKDRKSAWVRWLGWSAVGVLGFAAGAYWMARASESHKLHLEAAASSLEGSDGIVVTAGNVVVRPVKRTINAVGTLHAFEELVLSSKVEGRVLKIHHDLSSVVKPGDVLLELDDTDALLTVQQMQRSLQAELAKWGFQGIPSEQEDLDVLPNVVSAKLRYELARSRLGRMQPLRATNSISEEEFEQVKSDARVLESEWKNQQLSAKSAAAMARLRAAELAIAEQRLSDCKIRVPNPTIIDRADQPIYMISERMVAEGSMLRTGTEVFRLVLGRTLKLRLSIPESFVNQVHAGQPVTITTQSIIQPTMGTVSKISPSVDRTTRTFLVEVEVPNESGQLKPGSFAKASILVGESEQSITVPASAIYSLAGIQKIFLIQDGIAKEHHVQLGEQTRDWVEIISPKIAPDARVVTSGQRLLSTGIRVMERTLDGASDDSNSTERKSP